MHLIRLGSYILDETVKYLHTYVCFSIPTNQNTNKQIVSVSYIIVQCIHKSYQWNLDISFTIIFKKMLSICLFLTECKFRYAYTEKTCIFRYQKSKTGKMLRFILCCFIFNSWYVVMAYKQMFNKHVLETIQICDIFIYSNLWYKFLYS